MRALGPWVVVAALQTVACGSSDEHLHCTDLVPPSMATFSEVATLVTDDGPKGCASCHNTTQPLMGLNFEGPAVSYDALKHKMPLIYPQVASGAMPPYGVPWHDRDLRLLRSWYCHGALYDEP